MEDKLIYVLGALFILSVITEKLTQIVRSYPFQSRWIAVVATIYVAVLAFRSTGIDGGEGAVLVVFLLFVLIALLLSLFTEKGKVLRNVAKNNGADPDKKGQEISVLSLMLGVVIAFFFNASLIDLFSSESKVLGWGNKFPFKFESFELATDTYEFSGVAVVGYCLTGFFLTFGSKFFHELLEFILEARNLRKNFNENAATNEANLLRLQMDNKATLLAAATPDQKARIEGEIFVLQTKLTNLLRQP